MKEPRLVWLVILATISISMLVLTGSGFITSASNQSETPHPPATKPRSLE